MMIYVLGLDKRTAYCAANLKEIFNDSVILCDNAHCIFEPDVLVLPYVSFKKGRCLNLTECMDASSVLDKMKEGSVLFAGMVYDGIENDCKEREITLYDYFKDEDLTVKNAHLTAEGAIEMIMRNTDKAISGMQIAITGFGRVAPACAEKLSRLGAKITVLARKESARNEALALGYLTADICDGEALGSSDVIINTVPTTVLSGEMLNHAKNCKYILDLASSPFGTDFEAASKFGIKAETAPGLPAICAPSTAGRFIAEFISSKLSGGDTSCKQ